VRCRSSTARPFISNGRFGPCVLHRRSRLQYIECYDAALPQQRYLAGSYRSALGSL